MSTDKTKLFFVVRGPVRSLEDLMIRTEVERHSDIAEVVDLADYSTDKYRPTLGDIFNDDDTVFLLRSAEDCPWGDCNAEIYELSVFANLLGMTTVDVTPALLHDTGARNLQSGSRFVAGGTRGMMSCNHPNVVRYVALMDRLLRNGDDYEVEYEAAQMWNVLDDTKVAFEMPLGKPALHTCLCSGGIELTHAKICYVFASHNEAEDMAMVDRAILKNPSSDIIIVLATGQDGDGRSLMTGGKVLASDEKLLPESFGGYDLGEQTVDAHSGLYVREINPSGGSEWMDPERFARDLAQSIFAPAENDEDSGPVWPPYVRSDDDAAAEELSGAGAGPGGSYTFPGWGGDPACAPGWPSEPPDGDDAQTGEEKVAEPG